VQVSMFPTNAVCIPALLLASAKAPEVSIRLIGTTVQCEVMMKDQAFREHTFRVVVIIMIALFLLML
jgi:hypothetical protein